MAEHEYLFDVRMFAFIRVRAKSLAEARKMLREHLDCADCNFGSWPNGEPITCEASIDDDELPCVEIDGKWCD